MTIGLLLAGGNSSRFEYGDKALYQNFAERCFKTLSDLTAPVYISAKLSNLTALQTRFPQAELLLDEPPYVAEGPLSALYALSTRVNSPIDVLILSVDNPEVAAKSLQQLLDKPNRYADHYFTIAHLTFEAADLTTFLATGQRRIKKFLNFLDAQAIALPADELIDHNRK